MSIIRAIIEGERDPVKLAAMRDPRVKSSADEIAKALKGNYRQEHLFALKQAVELYDLYCEKIYDCDQEIEQYMQQFESKINLNENLLPKSNKKRRKKNSKIPILNLTCALIYTESQVMIILK